MNMRFFIILAVAVPATIQGMAVTPAAEQSLQERVFGNFNPALMAEKLAAVRRIIARASDLSQAVNGIKQSSDGQIEGLLIYNPRFSGEVVKVLAEKFTNGDIFAAAQALNSMGAIKWLSGISQNVPSSPELLNAQLLSAVEHNEFQIVAKLLAQRASANVADDIGDSALSKAVANNNPQLAALLIRAGANVNAQNYQGVTPLIIATQTHNHPLMEMLLQSGADVNQPDAIGTTPLMWAASRGNLNSIRGLLAYGARVNDQMPDGTTAIILSASRGDSLAVDILLQAGANPNLADRRGNAMHHAQVNGHQLVINVLSDFMRRQQR